MEQAYPAVPITLPIAVPLAERVHNAQLSLGRGLPRFTDMPETQLGVLGRAALVSGGPSAADSLNLIRKFPVVMACGSAGPWLLSQGIVPAYQVIFDPSEGHARFYQEADGRPIYLVASTCNDAVFEYLAGCDVRLWHPFDDVPEEIYRYEPRVGGGSTVTLRAIALAHILGLREQHLFGFDCSYRHGVEHAYPHDQDRPQPIEVNYGGRRFLTNPNLFVQAQEFMRMYQHHQHELACRVYGDGLLGHIWATETTPNVRPLDV